MKIHIPSSLPYFFIIMTRFLEALNHFEKAKTLIFRLPGVLTWPTSNVVIEETQPGKIKVTIYSHREHLTDLKALSSLTDSGIKAEAGALCPRLPHVHSPFKD